MKQLFQNHIYLFLLFFMAACKQEYQPKVKSSEQSVLVVEGILNSSGPTNIRLTRTIKLDDSARIANEPGAQVTIESKSGNTFPLNDLANGTYTTDQAALDLSDQYRVHIVTIDGNEYASDFVPVHQNPLIDSVNWTRDSAGVTVYVNTHDPQNNTRYYRWEYEETWEIRSRYFADPIPDDGLSDPIYPGENIYYCWKSYNSSNLILGTTTQLSSDVVFEKPLFKITDGDDRLSERYTVLVRQYALDKQGYEFYQLMKKNTESLGSIFDAQPSEITGNLHSISNATTPVIGYIMASTVDSVRQWITMDQVPYWKPWADCSQNRILDPRNVDIASFIAGHYWLIYYTEPFTGKVHVAPASCVSCRLRNGSTHKPTWW